MKSYFAFLLCLIAASSAVAQEVYYKTVAITQDEYERHRNITTYYLAERYCDTNDGGNEAATDGEIISRANNETTWSEWFNESVLGNTSPTARYALRCRMIRYSSAEIARDSAEVARLNRAEAARADSLSRSNPKAGMFDGILSTLGITGASN